MQTLSPPDRQNNPPIPGSRRNLARLGAVALGLLLFSALFYLPAFLNPAQDIRQNTLVGKVLPLPVFGGDSYFPLMVDWSASRDFLLKAQIPLWQNDTNGGRPLLASTTAPVLYPFSVFYYLFGNLFSFAAFHLWLALCGVLLLASKLPSGIIRWMAVTAGIAVILLLLPSFNPGNMAMLAWLPLALWLPLSRRRYVKLLALGLVLGLAGLAGETGLFLMLLAVCLVWVLLIDGQRENWKARKLWSVLMWAVIVSILALFYAAPQLFPRFEYRNITYQNPASTSPILLEPANAILAGEERVSDNERRYRVTLVPGSGGTVKLIVPESFYTGWAAHYSLPEDPRKLNEGKLVATREGWRELTVTPPAGTTELIIRMRYNPLSFTLGLYAAFLSLASEALILLVLGWVRFYREDEQDHPLRRIAKNSITPMFAQLAGKVIDFGFAFISLRLLGPEGNGRYTFAVTTWLFFNTLADFGLETLVTREVARDRSYANSNRYFSTMLVMRLAFTTLSLPGAMLWMGLFGLSGEVTGDVVLATALLMVGMAPSAVSATMSAVFRGHEKFEYLAAMQIMASIIKVPLGLGALLIGWGVAGLAGSSIAVNLVTMASLWSIFTRAVIKPDIRKGFERLLVRPMLVSAFPLMLNGFLIGLMFKSDVFLLYPFRGDIEVGLYNSAYKFIDALLIFPSAITMALFPLFSSYSSNSRENMMRAYSEGLRLLSILSLPISAGTLFIAYDIIGLAFGDKFLPGGAIALQILIWFLPFSYINGVTQYVLIAIDRQRFITWAVIITATCNIALNLALIPFFGYIAASALTIVTEVILLVIYAYLMKREIAPIPFWHTLARPGAATLLMIGVLLVLNPVLGINNFFVTVIAGTLVYLGGLALFKAITAEDISYVRKILRR